MFAEPKWPCFDKSLLRYNSMNKYYSLALNTITRVLWPHLKSEALDMSQSINSWGDVSAKIKWIGKWWQVVPGGSFNAKYIWD